MVDTIDKLKNLNLDDNDVVTLTFSEGTDVFVHNESEVETALEETSVVSAYANLVSTPGLNAETAYGENILETLRDSEFLEEYDRDFTFSEYLTEKINENFYDVDLIEYSTEKYDYKRGFCTLTAGVKVTAKNLFNTMPSLAGWEAQVKTDNGVLTVS